MSVKIRLIRRGKKKFPHYRIVVTNSRSSLKGWFIEDLGSYHPLLEESPANLNEERTLFWLTKGAEPTEVVRDILRKKGILAQLHQKTK